MKFNFINQLSLLNKNKAENLNIKNEITPKIIYDKSKRAKKSEDEVLRINNQHINCINFANNHPIINFQLENKVQESMFNQIIAIVIAIYK